MAEMLEGVRIILERMKTNPEEFDVMGKWGWLMSLVNKDSNTYPLTKEEQSAIRDELLLINRERFNQRVMQSLVEGAPSPGVGEQLNLPYMTSFSTKEFANKDVTKIRLQLPSDKYYLGDYDDNND